MKATVHLGLYGSLLVGLAIAGCSGGDGGGDDLGPPPSLSCDPGTPFRMTGMINGTSYTLATTSGYGAVRTFEDEEGPGNLDEVIVTGTAFEPGIAIYMEWGGTLMDNGAKRAEASIEDADRGFVVGSCIDDGERQSTIWSVDADEEDFDVEYRWEITGLRTDPFCSGAPVTGTVGGCIYFDF